MVRECFLDLGFLKFVGSSAGPFVLSSVRHTQGAIRLKENYCDDVAKCATWLGTEHQKKTVTPLGTVFEASPEPNSVREPLCGSAEDRSCHAVRRHRSVMATCWSGRSRDLNLCLAPVGGQSKSRGCKLGARHGPTLLLLVTHYPKGADIHFVLWYIQNKSSPRRTVRKVTNN